MKEKGQIISEQFRVIGQNDGTTERSQMVVFQWYDRDQKSFIFTVHIGTSMLEWPHLTA